MSLEIIIQIILFGFALSMDAFAVSITDGLIYKDLNKKRIFVIALTFGLMQGIMPLAGFWIVELAKTLVGETGGAEFVDYFTKIVTYVSSGLLLLIGSKMLIEAIKQLRKAPEEKKEVLFSYKEVFFMGIATAIDALAVGVSLHADAFVDETVWIFLHVTIIIIITFMMSLIGLFAGKQIEKLLKGKYEISSIIGGAILISLSIWILLSHLLGI